jgi:hypothetical protein
VTLIVGIKCSDGVVLASDSAATYNQGLQFTIGQQVDTKIHQVGDEVLYMSTGAIGVSQILREAIENLATVKGYAKAHSSAEAMSLVADIIAQKVRKLVEPAVGLVSLVGQQRAGITVLCQSLVACLSNLPPIDQSWFDPGKFTGGDTPNMLEESGEARERIVPGEEQLAGSDP